jgi:pimeloyl-ACP methyl ester carboxylesterase
MVGISMGSAIALQLALKYPKKVKGLGLFGGGAKLRVSPIILETIGNENSFESAVDMVNENCFSEHAPRSLVELSKRYMMQMRPPVLLGDFLACNQFDVTSQLGNIKPPTLIVCGAEDKMTPVKLSELLKNGIGNSELYIMDHIGHMVMLEQPDASADLLRKFIDSLPQRVNRATKKRITPNGIVDSVS